MVTWYSRGGFSVDTLEALKIAIFLLFVLLILITFAIDILRDISHWLGTWYVLPVMAWEIIRGLGV